MTSKSKTGHRRDQHAKAPDAATRKVRRAKHLEKQKLAAKETAVQRREARAEIRGED